MTRPPVVVATTGTDQTAPEDEVAGETGIEDNAVDADSTGVVAQAQHSKATPAR